MRLLSALDASFIYLESDHTPMHIGGVYLMNAATTPPGFGFAAFRDHIRSRLQCSSIFRQRLVEVPFSLAHPCWINDPDFNLEQHLPRFELPRPGGKSELMKLAAQVFGKTLARDRPLWEFGFVENLDDYPGLDPGSFALISKVHHAAVDGGSGVELMGALLDISPEPRSIDEPDDWAPEAMPGNARMVKAAYSRMGRKSLELGKLITDVATGTARVYGSRKAQRINPPPMPLTAPPTLLNGPVSSSRTFWGVEFEFERIRRIRKHLPDSTINDIVLAVCAGGLRQYLVEKKSLPERPLVTMAPISVRKEGQKGEMGNQVSAMLVSLATDVEDPLQRLLMISQNTRSSKIYASAIPANRIAEFIPSETLAAATRLYTRTRLGARHRPFFNLTITNVPGPPVPLYLAGAPLTEQFGMAPIIDGMGLIIVVLSYAGRISLGLTSCYKVIPDIEHFGQLLAGSLDELESAVEQMAENELEAARQAVNREIERHQPEQDEPELNPAERLRESIRALDDAMAQLENKINDGTGKK